ncbi:hypothetical protein ASPZODRAFT_136731 [Penicilliopsis zonata CBS 506.65]|uniref:Putative lipase ATG15 n=1 Tax=Penicilliopsis zonata CBS 506.65 TaxID=1073090 RepID=A0A1L9S7P8_9EURO|nr:hypothetical protein ASPZODRAFT_136731 [Penicilliopsis zonata CBS 506.65]OJJ43171.1 hypothetical protein ASPZODRAFT_136731 [Penicilliopsis zonata CBS 506.65]
MSGPNIRDKTTVVTLAKISSNDYVETPGTGDWEDVHDEYNHSTSFGWRGTGLRGHVFADERNETIVLSLKGTSLGIIDRGALHDKVNDNLFFSCCCGQGGQRLWRQVCDCSLPVVAPYTANATCLAAEVRNPDRYYMASLELYANVTAQYPTATNVWLTGHSLGGAIAALLGMTTGLPTVTFQAVPAALPAQRLGLLLPQSRGETVGTHVYNFGHTADPIYMGACNGYGSTCTWAGFAFESVCHAGRRCVYDTVADKGWGMGISSHRILTVLREVLEVYDEVPACEWEDPECEDCGMWQFM